MMNPKLLMKTVLVMMICILSGLHGCAQLKKERDAIIEYENKRREKSFAPTPQPSPRTENQPNVPPPANVAPIAGVSRLAIVVSDATRKYSRNQGVIISVEDAFSKALMNRNYSIVSRSNIEDILKEHKLEHSGLTDTDAVKMGKIMNVPAILLVSIVKCDSDRRTVEVPTLNIERIRIDSKRKTEYIAVGAISARLLGTETAQLLWLGNHEAEFVMSDSNNPESVLPSIVEVVVQSFPAPGISK